jgi:hypothetical protein
MNSPSYVFTSRPSTSTPASLAGVEVAFVGGSVDERGSTTFDVLKNASTTLSAFRFDANNQKIYLDEHEINRERLVAHMSNKKRILLDVTTLGLGEILHILIAAKQGGHQAVEFLYAEPGEYTPDSGNGADDPQRREFKLTKNCSFKAVLGFAQGYQPNMNAVHVFFLGFEPGRIRNAFESLDDFDPKRYRIQIILGVPAFQTGWESNAIRPHLNVLEERDISEHSISYCQANSIRESYLTLWDLYRQLGDDRGCFYVSPLGTKPQAVGAALFLLETKGVDPTTSLFYDHPERVSNRSSNIATWHHVTVCLEVR